MSCIEASQDVGYWSEMKNFRHTRNSSFLVQLYDLRNRSLINFFFFGYLIFGNNYPWLCGTVALVNYNWDLSLAGAMKFQLYKQSLIWGEVYAVHLLFLQQDPRQ